MKHQLYLKCHNCKTYFPFNGGKRRSVCSDKCKVALWRKKKSFMVDGESLRTYDDNGKLTSVQGMNKNGEYGIWIDTEGLCPHERIKQYCEDCNE